MMTQLPDYGFNQAAQAAEFLRSRMKTVPVAAIFTGTGLGQVAASAKASWSVAYADIPNMPAPTVESHHGRLVAGEMAGRAVAIFQGRFHLYEGYSPQAVTFPIRILQCLGVRTLILTNAAGGLNPLFSAGDVMVIEDHINLTGENPLVGVIDPRWGPRFPEIAGAHNGKLQDLARCALNGAGAGCRGGIYAGLKGPSLETAAEMRFLRTIGADAVGFSTVMETIAGVHAGMQVLGLSVITNMCLPDRLISASVEEIIATAENTAPRLGGAIRQVLESVDGEARIS